MPFTLPVAFFSQDSSNTINYTVTYSISPDVGTFSSTSALSQDGTKSISADGITFQSNNSNIVADCAKIQLDTDRDEYRDVTVTLTITDGSKTKTVSKVLTGISAFSVSNLNQTIFTNEDVNPTLTTMVVTDSSDVSATGDVTVTITNNNTSAATLSSSAGTYNSSTGVYTLTDSIANVNTALAALTVSLTANFNGDISLTTAFNDTGSVHTANGQIDITVVSVNDAPTWSNVVNYTYNDTDSTFSYNGPDVADADNNVITMTAALQDNIGTLSSNQAGVTQNNNQTLIAVGLPATVNNVLDNLTFNKTGSGQSSIIFYADDGTANVNQTSSLLFERNISGTITPTLSATSSLQGTFHLSSDIQTNSTIGSVVLSQINVSSSVQSTSNIASILLSEIQITSDINSTSSLSAPKLTGTYHITAPTGVVDSFSSTATFSASKFTGTYSVSANITPSATVSSIGLLPTYNLQDTVALPSGASISETKLANSGRFALVDTGNDDTIVYDHTSYTYNTTPTTVTDAMTSVDMSNNGNILVGVENSAVEIYTFTSSWSLSKTTTTKTNLTKAFVNGDGDRVWACVGLNTVTTDAHELLQSFLNSGTWGNLTLEHEYEDSPSFFENDEQPNAISKSGEYVAYKRVSGDTVDPKFNHVLGYHEWTLGASGAYTETVDGDGELESLIDSLNAPGNSNDDDYNMKISDSDPAIIAVHIEGTTHKLHIIEFDSPDQAVDDHTKITFSNVEDFDMSANGNIIVYQTTGNVIKVLERRNKIFKEVQDLGSGTKPAVSADGSLIGFISGTDFKIYK